MLYKHAIISNNTVINIIEYETIINGTMPGFPEYTAIDISSNNEISMEWIYNNGEFTNPNPIIPPEPPVIIPSFYARDLIALFTDEDQVAIDTAITASPTLKRIWNGLLAQGDQQIQTTAERCIIGWTGLIEALGRSRCVELCTALGIDLNTMVPLV